MKPFNFRMKPGPCGRLLCALMLISLLQATHAQNIPVANTTVPAPTVPVVIMPAAYANSGLLNSTKEYMPVIPLTDTSVLPVQSTGNVGQMTEYFDNLGRLVQTVVKQATPLGMDLVQANVYDSLGRESYPYLPFVSTTNDGSFKLNAFQQDSIFNSAQFPGEKVYYGQSNYEASPLGRIQQTMIPGNSWAGSNVGIAYHYLMNSASDSVKIWMIDTTAGSIPTTSSTANYGPGQLIKNVIQDEAGHQVITYTDKQGRIILKKSQSAVNPGTAHVGWLCTYYVYDDIGNLRFILTPQAIASIDGSWTVSQACADGLCYRYEYDGRRRIIIKKTPGAGEVDYVYDNLNRLVFYQDANARSATQWIVIFYDGLSRPVMKAIYPSSSTQADLQTMMNGITGPPGSTIIYNGSTTTDTLYETSPNNPVPNITGYQPQIYFYYDNYSWGGARSFDNGPVSKLSSGSDPYPDPCVPEYNALGLMTGTKVRILNSSTEQWLTTTIYYDVKNRPLQVLSDNITGATDELTNQYDFSGKTLSSYLDHKNAHSGTTPETKVLTEYSYDSTGRLLTLAKQLNDDPATLKTIASYSYNELGQLVRKSIGRTPANPLDTLHYDYNIQGWLSGINKPYVNSTATEAPAPGSFFGTELDYNYGFNQNQVNGAIAGVRWKSAGDGYARAFGYSYDDMNRISKADFTQNNAGTWNNTLGSGNIDFSVSNLQYDANGNIQSMKQMGLKVNNSAAVDELNYAYNANSNQLLSVTDTVSDPNTTLGDFHDGKNAAGSADYSYDGNGNLTEDLNKNISAITYNYLNLPQQVTVTGKGNIQFVYDALGRKWQKIVTDQTQTPNLVTTTTYINGFIYQSTSTGQTPSDTLQYFSQEEGRIRPKLTNPALGYQAGNVQYIYDYFEKDHLGNTRMVLTEETDTATYAATMEPQNATTENALFSNISSTTVGKPVGFDTDPNNTQVSQLDGSNGNSTLPRVGPAIVLKVMAGDTIMIATNAWYNTAVQPPPSGASSLLNDLLNALTGGVINSGNHGIYGSGDNNPSTVLSGDLPGFFTNNENPNYNTNQPKAFLNWVAFDEQLNMVSANSGVVQVPVIASGTPAQALVAPTQIITKNGYIYIYVSNESAQKVFFDNLVIHHNRGPILEETHYYPFGLTMAGISDMAALKPGNPSKFNSGTELDSSLALNWYETPFRGYDPQIGRFNEPDPLGEKYPGINPYQFAYDMPNMFIDPWGLEDTTITDPNGGTLIGAPNGATSSDNGQTVQNSDGRTIYTWDSNCGCYEENLQELVVVEKKNGESDNNDDGMGEDFGFGQFNFPGTDLGGEIVNVQPLQGGRVYSSNMIIGDAGFNDHNDPMRGGRQNQRDQSIKRYPKEFQRWYHKEIKPDVHPGRDATPEELEEGYQDWLDQGSPTVKTVATGLTWGLIGWGTYEGVKWGAAIIFAPETGGGSLVGAVALP